MAKTGHSANRFAATGCGRCNARRSSLEAHVSPTRPQHDVAFSGGEAQRVEEGVSVMVNGLRRWIKFRRRLHVLVQHLRERPNHAAASGPSSSPVASHVSKWAQRDAGRIAEDEPQPWQE